MIQNFLLRVEAVNLNNFIYDTNKIQPTRGGSFLLLESVQQLADKQFAGVRLKKITTGASIGIYRFDADKGIKPEDVANAVLEDLNKCTAGHATFVVDCLQETGNFKDDNLQLQAMNRWRQYQQPTLVLPEICQKETKVCAFDGVRPGVKSFLGEPASASVKFRADSGIELRQEIYEKILSEDRYQKIFGTGVTDIFTDDIQKLSFHDKKGNLNNKIAFIYLDGNKFTKIRTAMCDTSDHLTDFSNVVETSRSNFLAELLAKAKDDDDFKIEGNIRLETLLWGGDELEIIVPAWKGWEVLSDFFGAMKNVYYDKAPLTHAGGIVFCNHKAPIREIRRMAHELAEMTKKAIKDDFTNIDQPNPSATHARDDAFHFLVLKSFDTVGDKVKLFAQTYFGKTIWQNMQMGSEEMGKLSSTIETMKVNAFPHNKLFDIVRDVKTCIAEKEKLMAKGKDVTILKEEQTKQIAATLEKVLDGVDKKEDMINEIKKFIGGEIERWFVISELWDYVYAGGAA